MIILTMDVKTDRAAIISATNTRGKGADSFLDFSPVATARSTFIASLMVAPNSFGKACFISEIYGNVEIDYLSLTMRSVRARKTRV